MCVRVYACACVCACVHVYMCGGVSLSVVSRGLYCASEYKEGEHAPALCSPCL